MRRGRRLRSVGGVVATLAVAATASTMALAGTGIHVEGVDDYPSGNITLGDDAAGFLSEMTSNGWASYYPLYNGDVWDADFFDKEMTGSTNDVDYWYMDPEPSAMTGNTVVIAYYGGHGLDLPANPSPTSCTHDTSCTSPPDSGYYSPGICTTCPSLLTGTHWGCDPTQTAPDTTHGVCRYWPHVAAFVHGDSSYHSDKIHWGDPNSGIAFGESPSTSGWYHLGTKNAGTNGGVNMVVMHQSYAGTPGLWQFQTQNLFAGMHLFGMTSPTDSDVSDAAINLGKDFAMAGQMMPSGSIGDAFISTMGELTGGGGCPGGSDAGDGILAGGYNGCGCNTVISFDNSYTLAGNHVFTEDWSSTGIRSDLKDGTSDAYWETYYECNYDLGSYHFSNP